MQQAHSNLPVVLNAWVAILQRGEKQVNQDVAEQMLYLLYRIVKDKQLEGSEINELAVQATELLQK